MKRFRPFKIYNQISRNITKGYINVSSTVSHFYDATSPRPPPPSTVVTVGVGVKTEQDFPIFYLVFGSNDLLPEKPIRTMPSFAVTPRSSAYFSALTQEIDKKLQKAIASPNQRRDLLQALFADIALEVDDRARDIILGREDAESDSRIEVKIPICFYDVLAHHFSVEPEHGKPILVLIVQLWSQPFASHIFALLFHKWLFEVELDSSDVLLRYSSALVQGATNVFWIDIQTNTTHFQSLFLYLLDDVALEPTRLKKIPLQTQRDLFLLLSRFIFLYNLVDKIESFLKNFPEFPNAFLVGGPADIFVIELTDQLQKLKVEPVLLHYLSHIKVLQGLELRMTTSTRLKTCLYSFTSPGGPMYPTRAVRHAAWDALDFLFPVGRYPRHIISLFFRLMYPWYWPSSCWNFVLSCIQAILYSILSRIFPSRMSRNPKRS